MPAVAFLLDNSKEAIDKLNWHLENGYGLVDRFDLGNGSFIVVVMKPQTYAGGSTVKP